MVEDTYIPLKLLLVPIHSLFEQRCFKQKEPTKPEINSANRSCKRITNRII